MSSQVSPINGASAPTHPRPANAASFIVSIPEDPNGNEQILKTMNEIYSPVLKLMKLFGVYYGHTNLKHLENTSASHVGKNIFSRIHSGLMISVFWWNFVMAFVGIFTSGQVYIALMFALGNLLIVICGISLLIVLPLTVAKKSRFEKFLRRLLANVRDNNLEAVKKKSRKGFIIFCFTYMGTIAPIFVIDQMLGLNIALFKPWDQWFGFRIISLFSLVIGCAVWLLSILFFYLTCMIVEECFNEFYQKMSSSPPLSVDLPSLKMEYHKLSEVVELADKMLAPLLLGIVSLYIPLLCVSLYNNTVVLSEKTSAMFLASNLSWCLVAAGVLAIVLFFGSKVSEKVCQGNLL